MFIEVNISSGPLLVNINQLAYVNPTGDDRALLKFANGDIRTSNETFDEVRNLIDKAQRQD